MATIQVKHVPDDVHRELRARAAAAGQSLQEYLLAVLTAQARTESLDQVLARVAARAGGSLSFDFAVDTVRADRDRDG
ncbi:MAG TPA: hypothetical protein VKV21_06280 [Solirubrobacteraceae bacterium]|nr:hypothetical protein [Solirubrobacteraceae bacterium]